MTKTTENAIEWVRVKFLAAMLYLSAWREPGDVVPIPLDRAKHLKEQKRDGKPIVEFIGEPQFSPLPIEKQPRNRERTTGSPGDDDPPGSNETGNNFGGDDNPPTDGANDLDELGLPPKTIDLLVAGGIATVADLRQKVADGFDLQSIEKIGKATADSIVAALNET